MLHLKKNIKRIINRIKDIDGTIDAINKRIHVNSTIYLTFDDGPSQYTEDLLSVLKKHNVKATFFVTFDSPEHEYLIGKAYDSGHAIGAHAYHHIYSEVYADEESYFNDLGKIQDVIKRQTGQETKYIRFPGGSSNRVSEKYQKGIMTILTNKVTELGYRYFDWNAASHDSSEKDPKIILKNAKRCIMNVDSAVILFHDSKPTTPKIIDKLISWGLRHGCKFLPIDDNTPDIHHEIVNK